MQMKMKRRRRDRRGNEAKRLLAAQSRIRLRLVMIVLGHPMRMQTECNAEHMQKRRVIACPDGPRGVSWSVQAELRDKKVERLQLVRQD